MEQNIWKVLKIDLNKQNRFAFWWSCMVSLLGKYLSLSSRSPSRSIRPAWSRSSTITSWNCHFDCSRHSIGTYHRHLPSAQWASTHYLSDIIHTYYDTVSLIFLEGVQRALMNKWYFILNESMQPIKMVDKPTLAPSPPWSSPDNACKKPIFQTASSSDGGNGCNGWTFFRAKNI